MKSIPISKSASSLKYFNFACHVRLFYLPLSDKGYERQDKIRSLLGIENNSWLLLLHEEPRHINKSPK